MSFNHRDKEALEHTPNKVLEGMGDLSGAPQTQAKEQSKQKKARAVKMTGKKQEHAVKKVLTS